MEASRPRTPARLVVGRVVRAHGNRGEVVVEPMTDAPDRFAPRSRLGAGDAQTAARQLIVRASRPLSRGILVSFTGVRTREEAATLRGMLLTIPIDDAMQPPEGSYYPHQIEGLEAVDESGARLGVVVDVQPAPASDLWIVDTGSARVMVPAVAEFVRAVDLAAGRVVLRPIPGLFEDER